MFGAGRAAEQPGLSEPKQLLCFGLLGRREQQQRAEELFQQVGLGSWWVGAALLRGALQPGDGAKGGCTGGVGGSCQGPVSTQPFLGLAGQMDGGVRPRPGLGG